MFGHFTTLCMKGLKVSSHNYKGHTNQQENDQKLCKKKGALPCKGRLLQSNHHCWKLQLNSEEKDYEKHVHTFRDSSEEVDNLNKVIRDRKMITSVPPEYVNQSYNEL